MQLEWRRYFWIGIDGNCNKKEEESDNWSGMKGVECVWSHVDDYKRW